MSNKDQLFSYFNLSFDENDLNLQDASFNLLNQIIEKIVILRYKKSLDSFKYSSTGDIYEELFSLYSSKNSKEQVELFAKDIYEYIGEAVPLSRIITDIESCLEYLSFMSGVYSPTSLTEKLSGAIQGDDYESAYSIISQSFKNNRFYHEIIGYNLIQYITKNDDNFQKLVNAITKDIEKLHKSNPNYIQDLKYQQQTHPNKYLDLNIIQDIQNQKYQEVAGVIAKKIIDNKDYHELTAFIDSFLEEGGKDFISFIASKTMDPISLFCNKVLNHAEDKWKREETEKIKANTKGHLKVTEKLKNRYYKSRVMEYIEHCIKDEIYTALDFDSQESMKSFFKTEIEKSLQNLLASKKQKPKTNLDLTILLEILQNDFLSSGKINEDFIINEYQNKTGVTISKEDAKNIANKVNYLRYRFMKNVEERFDFHISDSWFDTSKRDFDFNVTNFGVVDNTRIQKVVSMLREKIDEEEAKKILHNKNIKDVLFLLPFVGLVEELDIDSFFNILMHIDEIEEILRKTNEIQKGESSLILLKKLNNVIDIARGLSRTNNGFKIALGDTVLSKIPDFETDIYMKYYIDMINGPRKSIPPINMTIQNRHYNSGDSLDPNRLLLEFYPNDSINSCVKIGSGTSNNALLEDSGDAILVRNDKNEIITRVLVYRRGNVVQLISKVADIPVSDLQVYEEIAKYIIQQAREKQDNIDFVFINQDSILGNTDQYVKVDDGDFKESFPHADTVGSAYLLCSKEEYTDDKAIKGKLDFKAKPLATYEEYRQDVIVATDSNNTKRINDYKYTSLDSIEEKVMRLRIIKKTMDTVGTFSNNTDFKELKKDLDGIERFIPIEYEKVVLGEDWYIAIKKDGTVEELKLPRKNKLEMKKEIQIAKEKLGIDLDIMFMEQNHQATDSYNKRNSY